MSATATPPKPAGTDKQPTDPLVECPKCHQLFHQSELLTPPHDEFPRVVYKTPDVKAKEHEPPPPETEVVNNEDELNKALGEGWSEDPPQPKTADKSQQKAPEPAKAQAQPQKK